MKLVEVIVAGTVLALASTSSLQMAASSAALHRGTQEQKMQLEGMERDRLRLQGLWREMPQQTNTCIGMLPELIAVAEGLQPPTEIHRQVSVNADGQTLQVRWQIERNQQWPTRENVPARERVINPAGLGICTPMPEIPITDAALEESTAPEVNDLAATQGTETLNNDTGGAGEATATATTGNTDDRQTSMLDLTGTNTLADHP